MNFPVEVEAQAIKSRSQGPNERKADVKREVHGKLKVPDDERDTCLLCIFDFVRRQLSRSSQ